MLLLFLLLLLLLPLLIPLSSLFDEPVFPCLALRMHGTESMSLEASVPVIELASTAPAAVDASGAVGGRLLHHDGGLLRAEACRDSLLQRLPLPTVVEGGPPAL